MSAARKRSTVLGDQPEMRRAGAVARDTVDAAAPAWACEGWVRLVFPSPPSINQAYRNVPGRGRVATKKLNDWKSEAAWHIRADFDGHTIGGDFVAILAFERDDEAADLDNKVKLTFDALQRERVIVNDKFSTGFAASWVPRSPEHKRPRAIVTLTKASAFAARFFPLGAGRGGWFIDLAGEPQGAF